MSNALVINIIRFIGIYLFQILILFNINLHPSINLFIYPIFILLLPIRIPHALLISIAFILGVMVGLQYNAVGQHAAASVFIAFLRPTILNIMEPRGGFDPNQSPNKHFFGFSWFLQFSALLFFIHFCSLFILEVFTFNFIVLIKILFSYIISMLMLILFTTLFNPKT